MIVRLYEVIYLDNRPKGREKHITGTGKDVYKHGEGLGTGPVGSTGGSGSFERPQHSQSQSQSQTSGRATTRAIGRISPIVIIIILVLIFFGGKIFGGGGGSDQAINPTPFTPSQQDTTPSPNTTPSSNTTLSSNTTPSSNTSGLSPIP